MPTYNNHENNKHLVVTNEELLKNQKQELLKRLRKGEHIYVFFDTETTGTEPFPKRKEDGSLELRDRVIEVGMIFYGINNEGKLAPIIAENAPIVFHEYINPAKEDQKDLLRFQSRSDSHPDAEKVHGISTGFLNGTSALGGEKLPKPAPVFNDIRPYMDDILCFDELTDLDIKGKMIGIGHNSINFDNTFLNVEMERDDIQFNDTVETPRTFDTMISDSKDTMHMMQELWTRDELKALNDPDDSFNVQTAFGDFMKPGYSMSYLAYILKVKEEGRENFHGALLDAEILANCFLKLIEHPKYLMAPNKLPIPAPVHDFLNNKISKEYNIDQIQHGVNLGGTENKVLTMIQTDASLQEGTGTVGEYINEAVLANLKELAMIDTGSMMNFVPFYEQCKKNDIKPIVGVTLKLESIYDVLNYIDVSKKNKSYNVVNEVTEKLFTELGLNYNGLDNFLIDNNIASMVEVTEYFESVGALFEKIRDKKADSAIKKDEASIKTKLIALLKVPSLEFNEKSVKDINKANKTLIREFVSQSDGYVPVAPFVRSKYYTDITLLAKSDEGLQSLRYLITETQNTGKYFLKDGKGLAKGEYALTNIDIFNNPKFTKDLTVLIGDSGDVLGRSLKARDEISALKIIKEFESKFENIVFDINSKMSKSDDRMQRGEAVYIGMLNNILSKVENPSVIATHHASFAKEENYGAHLNKSSILLDYKVDSLMAKPNRYPGQCIQTIEDLSAIFKNNEHLMKNSSKIIDGMEIAPELHNPKLPIFPTPNGEDQNEYFLSQVKEGFNRIVEIAFKNYADENEILESNIEKEREVFYKKYEERLQYEIDIIIDMDFPGYFLIKQDMIEFCKKSGIPVGAGRGSAAGSLVVYSLGITAIDPIEHGLIFERFLNPERVEMPDIDTDITGDDREKVLHYLADKYSQYGDGASSAAYIITKGTFSAKSTIKAIGKTKKMPIQWQDKLSAMISHTPGITIEESLDENEKLQNRYQSEAMTRAVLDEAMELEKVHRQKSTGKHAGGVVVGNLVSIAPIEYDRGIPVVQYDKYNIEAAGAVKFDLLGLGTLAVVQLAVKNVLANYGQKELDKYGIKVEGEYINFGELTYKNKKAYDLMKEANTSNVFQIESSGMKDLLLKTKPKNMEEVAALLALFRPGPLESGMVDQYIKAKADPNNISYDAEVLKPILEPTYGAILYQEQVMKIANDMAGYSLGGADKLRKAMGKKKPEEMEKQRGIFLEGSVKNGHDEELAGMVFDKMEKFAGYGFNKSHAVAYADLTYKTALLKANFPKEFMAAVLTCDANGNDSVTKINKSIASARDVGVRVTPPDVNVSELNFVTSGDVISYGLSGIKGASFDGLIENREKDGKFKNMVDMLVRLNAKSVSKSIMESLIQSGALDRLPLSCKPSISNMSQLDTPLVKRAAKRAMLMEEYNTLKDLLSSDKKRKEFNPETLEVNYKPAFNRVVKDKTASVKEMLKNENENLSSYVTGHPLDIGGMRDKLKDPRAYPVLSDLSSVEDYEEYKEGEEIKIAGIIKNGAFDLVGAGGGGYSKITLDDGTSDLQLFLFSGHTEIINDELKSKLGRKLQDGDIISIMAKFARREDKRSGKEKMNMNIDFIEFPEHPELGCIQVNSYAKPYRRKSNNQYQP